jgi:glycine/D-amino acid oxidase-like deaminating enzyme
MMQRDSDAIVIGAGLMGASVASALVKRGKRVIVLDAHNRGYKGGSSHGDSRITRTLNSEAGAFPKLAAESREAMRVLETTPGEIIRPMPAVFIMKAGSDAHRDALEQLQSRNQHAEQLGAIGVEAKYGLKLRSDEIALVDSEAAVFNPRLVLERLDALIEEGGEPVRFDCDVIAWSSEDKGVSVTTRDGGALRADQLVIATGGWTPGVMQMGEVDTELAPLPAMFVFPIPLFYFEYPRNPDVIPVTLLDDGKVEMYAMPEGSGAQKMLKVGFHQGRNPVSSPAEVPKITKQEKLDAR